jgi:hypothetical protein
MFGGYQVCKRVNYESGSMIPIKIFDRDKVCEHIDYESGLISVNSIFYGMNYNYYDTINNIIDAYIVHNEIFEMIMSIASKLANIKKIIWL